jgi:hypothetical protein
MEQVHDFHAGVLPVEGLILGPPFPRGAVGQFGNLLAHRPAVLQQPLLTLSLRHPVSVHADSFVQLLLQPKQFIQLVRFVHDAFLWLTATTVHLTLAGIISLPAFPSEIVRGRPTPLPEK